MKRVLFWPDTHVPFHDKRATELVLQVARRFKPSVLVVMGDLCDFYTVSSHSKNPHRVWSLQKELDEVHGMLNQLDSLGAERKIFIAGNHENRLERYLMDKAPALFDVVKVPDVLHLPLREWEYVPYKADIRIGKLYIAHDIGFSGKNAVRQALDVYGGNIVTAHTHRLMYVVEGNAKGEEHVAASFGWLGNAKQTDYAYRIKAAQWPLAFGIGYLADNGTAHLVPVPIVGYSCVVEGKEYIG